jgi:hypothetical protein
MIEGRWASGRAECKHCFKPIKSGDKDLIFSAGGGISTIVRHYHEKCVMKVLNEVK